MTSGPPHSRQEFQAPAMTLPARQVLGCLMRADGRHFLVGPHRAPSIDSFNVQPLVRP